MSSDDLNAEKFAGEDYKISASDTGTKITHLLRYRIAAIQINRRKEKLIHLLKYQERIVRIKHTFTFFTCEPGTKPFEHFVKHDRRF